MTWRPVEVSGGPEVRRLAVPGGWLYQVAVEWGETDRGVDYIQRWSDPVFVPDRNSAGWPVNPDVGEGS